MNLLGNFIGVAHAQGNFTLDQFRLFDIIQPRGGDATGALGRIITQVVGIVLIIAAIVAFSYLLMAGFQYITAGGDAAKAQTARQGIVNALIGIVIISIAYVLLAYVAGVTRRFS